MNYLVCSLAAVVALSCAWGNAAEITLDGSGVSQGYAAGCKPAILTDYMETGSWNARRIEPRDCAKVKILTPIFSWVMPPDLAPSSQMTLTVQGANNTTLTYSSATPRLLLPQQLAVGSYTWTVTYSRRNGEVVSSQPRRFAITKRNAMIIPGGVEFADKVAVRGHPRAVPVQKNAQAIARLAAAGDLGVSYAAYIVRADAYLTKGIPAAPREHVRADFPNDTEYNNWLRVLKESSAEETLAIQTLGYAAHFTGDRKYIRPGIDRLLALAGWRSDGATSEAIQDQANREIYLGLASGYDLFLLSLTEEQKNRIALAFNTRVTQTLNRFPRLNTVPYESHLLTGIKYSTEALMYVIGDRQHFPAAKAQLALAWEALITTSGTWAGSSDGAFGNGDHYGWMAMLSLSRLMAVVKLTAGVNLSDLPAMGKTGLTQIALTPIGARLRGQFGDSTEVESNYWAYSYDEFRLLASVTGNPLYETYWRQFKDNLNSARPMLPYHYLLLGLAPAAAPALAVDPAFPNSYVFDDAGIVAMHSKTTDPNRSSVFFRSSRLGSYNHSHADNNAFTFVSEGRAMLISGGYYPAYGTKHQRYVTRATRFKNALTFDGGLGQAEPVVDPRNPNAPGAPVHSMDARGKLINFQDDENWVVASGDAALAYRRKVNEKSWSPLLSKAYRTVAYNRREGLVVVYDYAKSDTKRKWELNFQVLNKPSWAGSKTLVIVNGPATACINVYTAKSAPGTYSETSGFPVAAADPVDLLRYPDQFQVRFAVGTATEEFTAVTVIRENCQPLIAAPEISFNGAEALVKINKGSLSANQGAIRIAY
ncbi:MAG: heparinase II/III family protein [Pseudomonas sp.]|uniref:heparinase II/III domain-containing protein n=1 Tax=Pseudomonas sp. TaxID=306 RepID=UPI003397A4BE